MTQKKGPLRHKYRRRRNNNEFGLADTLNTRTDEKPLDPELMDDDAVDEAALREWAKKLVQEGNAKYSARQWDAALRLYNEAIAICPNVGEYYDLRAAVSGKLGQWVDVLRDCQSAALYDPSNSFTLCRAGEACMRLDRYKDAVGHFRDALAVDPQDEYAQMGMHRATEFLALLDVLADAKSKEQHRRALDTTRAMNKLLKEHTPTQVRLAEMLIVCDKSSEALEILKKVVEREPRNVDALVARGLALNASNKVADAIASFQAALKLDPDHKIASTTLKLVKLADRCREQGNKAFRQGDQEGAIESYTQGLAAGNTGNKTLTATLYGNRAAAYLNIYKFQSALKDCDAALKFQPNYEKVQARRVRCLEKMGLDQKARKYLMTLLAKNRDSEIFKSLLPLVAPPGVKVSWHR